MQLEETLHGNAISQERVLLNRFLDERILGSNLVCVPEWVL